MVIGVVFFNFSPLLFFGGVSPLGGFGVVTTKNVLKGKGKNPNPTTKEPPPPPLPIPPGKPMPFPPPKTCARGPKLLKIFPPLKTLKRGCSPTPQHPQTPFPHPPTF